MISIVVPTYNEKENPRFVYEALSNALIEHPFELIFVDDSKDQESVAILLAMEQEFTQVRVLHREHEKGLGTAVVRGFQMALGDSIAVMDADLQHPPELLVEMLQQMDKGYDVVIPSRFVPGGNDGGLSPFRKLVSWTARVMGQMALKRVKAVTDPTSGFFLVKRKVVEDINLKPIGWKILIEILVRGNYETVVEIPYAFQPRLAGSSNMSMKEQWNYVKHLLRLVMDSPEDRRMYLFAMVGISGVLINMLMYVIFVHLYFPLWGASILSGFIAMLSNFIFNDRLTWHDARKGLWVNRFIKYVLTSLVGIGINSIVLSVLAYGLHVHYLIANILGIIVAMVWNFIVNNFWTWNIEKKPISVTINLSAPDNQDFETLKG